MGHTEEPVGDELRQTEPLSTLLLRERHHAESGGGEDTFTSLSLTQRHCSPWLSRQPEAGTES